MSWIPEGDSWITQEAQAPPATFRGAPPLLAFTQPLPTNEGLREGRRRGDWAGSECWEWMGTYCLDSLGPELCGFLGPPLVLPLPELSCGLALWSQGGAAPAD